MDWKDLIKNDSDNNTNTSSNKGMFAGIVDSIGSAAGNVNNTLSNVNSSIGGGIANIIAASKGNGGYVGSNLSTQTNKDDNNTILWIIGAIGLLAVIYLIIKKKK